MHYKTKEADRALDDEIRLRVHPDLGFGRIVASEIEVPNTFVNLG